MVGGILLRDVYFDWNPWSSQSLCERSLLQGRRCYSHSMVLLTRRGHDLPQVGRLGYWRREHAIRVESQPRERRLSYGKEQRVPGWTQEESELEKMQSMFVLDLAVVPNIVSMALCGSLERTPLLVLLLLFHLNRFRPMQRGRPLCLAAGHVYRATLKFVLMSLSRITLAAKVALPTQTHHPLSGGLTLDFVLSTSPQGGVGITPELYASILLVYYKAWFCLLLLGSNFAYNGSCPAPGYQIDVDHRGYHSSIITLVTQ